MFETRVPSTPLFCHQEFLEKLEAQRNSPVGKRATLLMQQLSVDARRLHYKSTSGANKGWRRSRLGGNHGSHFYAWWAPATAQPLRARGAEGFDTAPEGAIVLRDIRHHDDHTPATPQDLNEHYLPVGVPEIRQSDYGPAPWTVAQAKFANARAKVRVLKGHPGSGKTTALLHAADLAGADKTLYLTYSRDLANLARAYFDRYCSRDRQFQVLTYDVFLREIVAGAKDEPVTHPAESRRRFAADIANYARSLGPWSGQVDALYDEFHAHIVGRAFPVGVSRFEHCRKPRVSDSKYIATRVRCVGEAGAQAAVDVATRLEKMDPDHTIAERYFPELWLAWRAARTLMDPNLIFQPPFAGVGCIAIDECQDLTPIESMVFALRANLTKPQLFLAGDEAQTVRPTDFEWGWLSDILHTLAGTPTEFKLPSNLRSPRRLAMLVNHVWDLYITLEKRDRPSGAGYAEIEDESTDQLLYCTSPPGEELNVLLRELAARPGLALVALDAKSMEHVPEDVRGAVLSASDVKGLDFHSVCLLDGARQLQRVHSDRLVDREVDALRKRLAIDQLRVALSRPTERLFWIDIAPKPGGVQTVLNFLNLGELSHVAQSVPAAMHRVLEEEELDIDERIQRCLQDARQLLEVKPDLAWSRAMLAVTLLGSGNETGSTADPALRENVRLAAAEVSFTLAMRGLKLSEALSTVNLFEEAARQCFHARKPGLELMIRCARNALTVTAEERPEKIFGLAKAAVEDPSQVTPWFLTAIQPRLGSWIDQLESSASIGHNSSLLFPILLPFYEAMRLPDAIERVGSLRERTVQSLMKAKRYSQALEAIRMEPRPITGKVASNERKWEAQCLEKTGAFSEAAALYRASGDLEEAVDCLRQVPDLDGAYALMKDMVAPHPAKGSYDWMMQVREVFAQRPANFNKVMLESEKKALEALLEQGLGVQRKKPAPRKKAAATKKKPPSPF